MEFSDFQKSRRGACHDRIDGLPRRTASGISVGSNAWVDRVKLPRSGSGQQYTSRFRAGNAKNAPRNRASMGINYSVMNAGTRCAVIGSRRTLSSQDR